MVVIKSKAEIEKMRRAGRVVAGTLEALRQAVKPGMTTGELDRMAEDMILAAGAVPAFKGYMGYPAVVCASVNEQVVHGIPGLRKLENGDIIGLDLGAAVEGLYADAAITCPVGSISAEAEKLLETTRRALMLGIEQAVPGNSLGDIGYAVEECARKAGYQVVRALVGHGVGRAVHEDPQVPNFGKPGRGLALKCGMTLAIEPMINVGTGDVKVLPDRWTVVTRDGRLSAHFEHTVAVQSERPDILTLP